MSTPDPSEPIFILRASDLTAPLVVQKWIDANERRLGNLHPKIVEAKLVIREMHQWSSRKTPQ